VGDRRHQLAAPGGTRQRRPHLGVPPAAWLAPKRRDPCLVVSMAGRHAGCGWQLGLPLDVQRRGPTAKSATEVALEQIAAVRQAQGAGAPRPVVTLDSGYDLETLAQATVDADLLVRLAKKRVVYRAPERHPGRGRPRLHGEPLRLADEDTYGQPQHSTQLDHPAYGAVTIDVWTDLHVAGAPDAPFSVIRVQVERLPKKKLPPRPLWLAWIGGPLPADLSVLWRWYLRRFTVEHAFRFFKQTLGWTTVRTRNPEAADRWAG